MTLFTTLECFFFTKVLMRKSLRNMNSVEDAACTRKDGYSASCIIVMMDTIGIRRCTTTYDA